MDVKEKKKTEKYVRERGNTNTRIKDGRRKLNYNYTLQVK